MSIYVNGKRTDMTYLEAKAYLAEQEKQKASRASRAKKTTAKDSE